MLTRKPLARTLLLTLLLAAGCGPTRDDGLADRGIGGTGVSVADRGIGGTGIVGTVTAFGSVWVNGLRVDLPPTTAVRIEGRPGQPGDVRIGQTVAMTAVPGGPTGLTARTLDVRFAVAGPVERAAAGGALVLGQRIDLAEAEGTTALTAGRWVAVSGLRRPDGVIDATRVDPWDPARGWVLRGRLDAVTPKTLTVAGLTLYRGRGLDGALPEVGGMVRVTGAAAGKADGSAALTVEPDPFNPFGTTVGALSVETYVDGSGQTVAPGGPRIERANGSAAPARVVIDSLVTSGGGTDGGRAFGAPHLGGRSLPGTDPAARAAGLAGAGMRPEGMPGLDAPGMEGPGMEGPNGPLDGMRTRPGAPPPPGPNGGPPGPGGAFGGPGRGPGGSPHGSPRGGFGGGFGGGPGSGPDGGLGGGFGGRGGHF
ncbi:hypothetical protein SAMN02982917_0731 [Azospirillum oryzae]|uniref:DUF5666 domain-containing protein n=1 Tax=Azospirillum oryzae TaxID=286727 RepID=A0A1X7DNK2_9PROT|nr:DUF5666 domain-containing protein [Azospirillum oryzae]SMF18432.1 hypothetical protein SAMN02982917_0731 [Azospirillum oryzae]